MFKIASKSPLWPGIVNRLINVLLCLQEITTRHVLCWYFGLFNIPFGLSYADILMSSGEITAYRMNNTNYFNLIFHQLDSESCPVIIVGGGSILVKEGIKLEGVSRLIKPRHFEVNLFLA